MMNLMHSPGNILVTCDDFTLNESPQQLTTKKSGFTRPLKSMVDCLTYYFSHVGRTVQFSHTDDCFLQWLVELSVIPRECRTTYSKVQWPMLIMSYKSHIVPVFCHINRHPFSTPRVQNNGVSSSLHNAMISIWLLAVTKPLSNSFQLNLHKHSQKAFIFLFQSWNIIATGSINRKWNWITNYFYRERQEPAIHLYKSNNHNNYYCTTQDAYLSIWLPKHTVWLPPVLRSAYWKLHGMWGAVAEWLACRLLDL